MKGLLSTKTISSISDKKSAARIARHLPSLNNNQLTFEKTSYIAFPLEYLPLNLEAELKEFQQIELSITAETLTARQRGENMSMPVNLQRQKWMRVNFGQEWRKVVLRLMGGFRKVDRKSILTQHQHWKQQQKQQAINYYHISVQPLLLLLKLKTQKQERKTETNYKNSISGFMRSKFSERGNLKSHNAIVKRSQNLIINRQQQEKKQTSTIAISRTRKHDSQTLQLENLMEQQRIKDRRESNASTSIRVQSRDIKFSKRIKKLRELAQTKNSYSQKQTILDDSSDLFPLTKIRPRFYQHINLSQQQIDLKRKKFDSQFITKKSTLPSTKIEITDKQVNESQVTEDIIKMQGSRSMAPVQDTLERGIQQDHQNGSQQSGTLCESVYQ